VDEQKGEQGDKDRHGKEDVDGGVAQTGTRTSADIGVAEADDEAHYTEDNGDGEKEVYDAAFVHDACEATELLVCLCELLSVGEQVICRYQDGKEADIVEDGICYAQALFCLIFVIIGEGGTQTESNDSKQTEESESGIYF